MAKKTSLPIRASKEFKKLLDDVRLSKIRSGKNNRWLSDRRLTLAISRVPKLKDILLEYDIKED